MTSVKLYSEKNVGIMYHYILTVENYESIMNVIKCYRRGLITYDDYMKKKYEILHNNCVRVEKNGKILEDSYVEV